MDADRASRSPGRRSPSPDADDHTGLMHRAQTVNDRIRSSDPFPRIHDAEYRVDVSRADKHREERRARKSRVYFNIDEDETFDYFADAAPNEGALSLGTKSSIIPTLFRKSEVLLPRKDDELKSLWMAGFIDESGRAQKLKSASMTQLPKNSEGIQPGSKRPSKGGQLVPLNVPAKGSGLSAEERAKLKEFAARVKKDQQDETGSPKLLGKIKKSKALEQGIKAYSEANRKMLQKKRRPKERPLIFSAPLHSIYDQEQKEHEAARIIQFHWKRGIMSRNLRFVVHCARMAVTIQRYARGMITRRWVRKWFIVRCYFAIQIQKTYRRFRSNKHLRPHLLKENRAAVRMQSVVRMRIARVRYVRKLMNFMATVIQCSWRGSVARAYSDKLWLNKAVIPIQSCIRRFVCRRAFLKRYKKYSEAATLIQKQFRSWQVTRMMSRRLFQRETNYRIETTKLLGLTEEHISDKITRLKQNLKKKGFRELLAAAHTDLQESFTHVERIETDLIELQHQKDQLSPRSLQLGWRKEIRDQGLHLRQNMSAAKLDSVLNKSLHLLTLNESVHRHVKEIEEHLVQEECIKYAREEEMSLASARWLTYRESLRADEHRREIGSEKRRWAIRHYCRDGKPDKRRRPGQPWAANLNVGREKDVFSGGHGIDLFALIDGNVKQSKNDNPGTAESINKIASQVTLQSYLNEVHKYETLLDPINEIMSNAMARAGGAEGGWGKISSDMDAAARGLDIVRDPDPPPEPKPITKPFQELIQKNREMGNVITRENNSRALVLASPAASLRSSEVSPQKSVKEGQFNLRDNTLKALLREKQMGDAKKKRVGHGAAATSVRSGMDGSTWLDGSSRSPGRGAEAEEEDDSTLDGSSIGSSSMRRGNLSKTGARTRWARRHAQETVEREEMFTPLERELGAKRAARKQRKTAIPWALLDKLEGEKKRFEAETKYLDRVSAK